MVLAPSLPAFPRRFSAIPGCPSEDELLSRPGSTLGTPCWGALLPVPRGLCRGDALPRPHGSCALQRVSSGGHPGLEPDRGLVQGRELKSQVVVKTSRKV